MGLNVSEDNLQHTYVRFCDEEWDALYIDGKLDKQGNGYTIDERLETLLRVEHISADGFFKVFQDSAPESLQEARKWDDDELVEPALLEAVEKYYIMLAKVRSHSELKQWLDLVSAPELQEFAMGDIFFELQRQREQKKNP